MTFIGTAIKKLRLFRIFSLLSVLNMFFAITKAQARFIAAFDPTDWTQVYFGECNDQIDAKYNAPDCNSFIAQAKTSCNNTSFATSDGATAITTVNSPAMNSATTTMTLSFLGGFNCAPTVQTNTNSLQLWRFGSSNQTLNWIANCLQDVLNQMTVKCHGIKPAAEPGGEPVAVYVAGTLAGFAMLLFLCVFCYISFKPEKEKASQKKVSATSMSPSSSQREEKKHQEHNDAAFAAQLQRTPSFLRQIDYTPLANQDDNKHDQPTDEALALRLQQEEFGQNDGRHSQDFGNTRLGNTKIVIS